MFLYIKGNKDGILISSFPRYYHSETIVGDFVKFCQKIWRDSEGFLQILMIFFLNDKDHHWLYFFYSVLEFWRSIVKVFVFPVNVEFIGTINVDDFFVQKLSRLYFYGKFDVWMITVSLVKQSIVS